MLKSKDQTIERDKRHARLEVMVTRGVTNQRELAAAFGVTQQCIGGDLKLIYQRWRESGIDDLDTRRDIRIRQLSAIALTALNAFERSRADSDPCPYCVNGLDEHLPGVFRVCPECGGASRDPSGLLSPRERAGDPTHLKVAVSCFVECARLEGLYPTGTYHKKLTVEGRMLHGVININHVEAEFPDASTDAIIAAKAAVAVLTQRNPVGIPSLPESN